MKAGRGFTILVLFSLVLFSLFCPVPAPAAPGDFRFQWGVRHALHNPLGAAPDRAGNLYVADTLHFKIQKFDGSGALLTQWGSLGSGAGQFTSPVALVVDGAGCVFVVDSNNNRIQKFDADGHYLAQWGGFGSADGQFKYPCGIALDGSGNVFVADSGNHRVQKFNNSGLFLATWGGTNPGSGNGQFSYPNALALDPSGNIYVADTFNSRIQKLSSNGSYQLQWGSAGSGPGQLKFPEGVALDAKGNVYVADTGNNRILVFTGSGALITSWGRFGFHHGQLNSPYGVALDSGCNLFVADTVNQRIQKFSSSGAYQMEFGGADANGQFSFPLAVALDGGDNVHLADPGNPRSEQLDPSGYYLSQGGDSGPGNGQLWYPNLALNAGGSAIVPDSDTNRIPKSGSPETCRTPLVEPGVEAGRLPGPTGTSLDLGANAFMSESGKVGVQEFCSGGTYLAPWGRDSGLSPLGVALDAGHNVALADLSTKIQRFTNGAGFITLWGNLGEALGQLNTPFGVAADGVGNIYRLDTFKSRVQVFDRAGNLKGQWGSFGTGKGQFSFPDGIATNAAGTIVYVADRENSRVQAFDGFGLATFTLNYSAGANGTVSGNAVQTVYSGGSGTQVMAKANPDYHFVSWSDGVTTAARRDTAVPDSLSVTANFALTEVNYTLRFRAGAGGALRGAVWQTVRSGASASAVSAVPKSGHRFVKWTGEHGFDATAANPLILRKVKENQNLIAYFAANQYQVTFVAGAHGELTGKKVQSVSDGGSTTAVTAVPGKGFHFVNWTDANNHVVSYSATLKFSNVTASKRVTANFK
jgi:sugar lactone lactonase YvrE